MPDQIELELTRIRRKAERIGNPTLLYMLDMAILEASGGSRVNRSDRASAATGALFPENATSEFQRASVTELKVVQ